MGQPGQYEIEAFPRIRELSIDLLREARRKHMIHALLEADVTDARRTIRAHRDRTGERLSFTAFIAYCLAQAVNENKRLHGYRLGRRKTVIFDDVDINTMVEREVSGVKMGTPNIIRGANSKSYREIHDAIRYAQRESVESSGGMEWFKWAPRIAALPAPVRSLMWRYVRRRPHRLKEFAGTVGLTAVGMFGRGAGWGFTIPYLTLNLVLGGIAAKPAMVDGLVQAREYLCITVSIDHEIVDGAPAARFVARLKELIEESHGLAALR